MTEARDDSHSWLNCRACREVRTVCSVVNDKVLVRECRTDQVKVGSVAGFRPPPVPVEWGVWK